MSGMIQIDVAELGTRRTLFSSLRAAAPMALAAAEAECGRLEGPVARIAGTLAHLVGLAPHPTDALAMARMRLAQMRLAQMEAERQA
jgi:hypothetical protein